DHPWFLGCQFHPEYKSKPTEPHPLFVSYIAAALAAQQRREQGEAEVVTAGPRVLSEGPPSTVAEQPEELPSEVQVQG
ncbi:hypothetical protein EHM82_08130, partial [bacterium]